MNSRFHRQVILPEIGQAGQAKLQQTKVLCVGAGGLGSAALPYLVGAGIGKIGICDPDVVVINNLPRQVLYCEKDVGKIKSEVAIERLQMLNKETTLVEINEFINANNVRSHLGAYDYVLDCTDNVYTKLILNDACHQLKKPFISASIERFEAQCSTFCVSDKPCLRCLYPQLANLDKPTCNDVGVLGMVPGIAGVLQALEVIKLCLNFESTLVGKLWHWDALRGTTRIYAIPNNLGCPLCTGQESFDTLWAMNSNQISAHDLSTLMEEKSNFFLVDVRNLNEHEMFNLGGVLIPLVELPQRVAELPRDKLIILYCRSGHRSQIALELLLQLGFKEVKNLSGGVLAWQQIKASVAEVSGTK